MPDAASKAMMIALLAGSLLSTRLYSSTTRPKLILKIMFAILSCLCKSHVLLFIEHTLKVSQPLIARWDSLYRAGYAIVLHGNMQTSHLAIRIIRQLYAT